MLKSLKKLANILWTSARRERGLFVFYLFTFTFLSIGLLSSTLSFLAIPLGILIGLTLTFPINHVSHKISLWGKKIPQDYVENLTHPQELLFHESLHLEGTVRDALPQELPVVLKDIVVSYVKIYKDILEPAVFNKIVERTDLLVLGGSSLRCFIAGFTSQNESQWFYGQDHVFYTSGQRERFFHDLWTLSFNNPNMLRKQKQGFCEDAYQDAHTPLDIFMKAIRGTILYQRKISFPSLLTYARSHLKIEEYMPEVLISLAELNQGPALDLFLHALASNQFTPEAYEYILSLPYDLSTVKEYLLRNASEDFLKTLTEKLNLPEQLLAEQIALRV